MTCVMGPVKYLCQFTVFKNRFDDSQCGYFRDMHNWISLTARAHFSSPISEEHFSIHKHCQSPGQLRTMKGNLNSLSNGFRCSLISPDVPSQVQSSWGRCELYATVHVKRSSIFVTKRFTCTWPFLLKQIQIWLQGLFCVNHKFFVIVKRSYFCQEKNINDQPS